MTDEQIILEVKRYLSDQTYNYALLVDGEWGCGKTFFANHKLRIAIDEHEKAEETNRIIKYVSLYGCKTIQDIYERIALSYVKDIFEKKGKEYPEKVSSVMIMAFKGLKEKFAPESNVLMVSSLGDMNEAFWYIANIEQDAIAVAELVGDGEFDELVEGLEGPAAFADDDRVAVGIDHDLDDVFLGGGVGGGLNPKGLKGTHEIFLGVDAGVGIFVDGDGRLLLEEGFLLLFDDVDEAFFFDAEFFGGRFNGFRYAFGGKVFHYLCPFLRDLPMTAWVIPV